MRIEPEAIDKVKREVDLVALFKAHGVSSKKPVGLMISAD